MLHIFFRLAASIAFAQDIEPSFISPTPDQQINKQTVHAILGAVCEGEVNGESCSKCPNSEQAGPWSFSSLILGHFSSPQSEEALAAVGTCYYWGNANPLGLLLAKRDGKWTKLEEILAFDPHQCMPRKFRSGREFLICESYEYNRVGERIYALSTLVVENGQTRFHNLFLAADTTRACIVEGKSQQAEVKNVEFRDLNGDGLEDISITATYGSFQMTERRREQCEAAQNDSPQTNGKPSKPYPRPPAVKTYKIDLLFDGNRFTPTPESRAAVAIFHWDR